MGPIKSMNIQDNYAGAVNRFGPVAQQYCSLVDSRSVLDKSEFLLRVYRMLPNLIVEASRLPLVSFPDEENEAQDATIRKIRIETELKQQEWGACAWHEDGLEFVDAPLVYPHPCRRAGTRGTVPSIEFGPCRCS